MKNKVFNMLDVIAEIDYCYFILKHIKDNKEMSGKEVRKESMACLRCIIKNKKKLGYNTDKDEETHKQIKGWKL